MQALSDEQRVELLEGRMDRFEGGMDRFDGRMDRLEKKMDDGFAAVRSEARSDFRTLIGVQLTTVVALILGFAGIILQHL
jgi:hypothetical protein